MRCAEINSSVACFEASKTNGEQHNAILSAVPKHADNRSDAPEGDLEPHESRQQLAMVASMAPVSAQSQQPSTAMGDPSEMQVPDDMDEDDSEDYASRHGKSRRPMMQGRFSGRLLHKDDEKKLADECRLLAPLLGGVGKRGDKSRLTLAKIVRGIASGVVRKHCMDRDAMLEANRARADELEEANRRHLNQIALLTAELAVKTRRLAQVDPDPSVVQEELRQLQPRASSLGNRGSSIQPKQARASSGTTAPVAPPPLPVPVPAAVANSGAATSSSSGLAPPAAGGFQAPLLPQLLAPQLLPAQEQQQPQLVMLDAGMQAAGVALGGPAFVQLQQPLLQQPHLGYVLMSGAQQQQQQVLQQPQQSAAQQPELLASAHAGLMPLISLLAQQQQQQQPFITVGGPMGLPVSSLQPVPMCWALPQDLSQAQQQLQQQQLPATLPLRLTEVHAAGAAAVAAGPASSADASAAQPAAAPATASAAGGVPGGGASLQQLLQQLIPQAQQQQQQQHEAAVMRAQQPLVFHLTPAADLAAALAAAPAARQRAASVGTPHAAAAAPAASQQ